MIWEGTIMEERVWKLSIKTNLFTSIMYVRGTEAEMQAYMTSELGHVPSYRAVGEDEIVSDIPVYLAPEIRYKCFDDSKGVDISITIAHDLRKARNKAAVKEANGYYDLLLARNEGREHSEEQSRYDYLQGRFSALSDAVAIVDEIMGGSTHEPF